MPSDTQTTLRLLSRAEPLVTLAEAKAHLRVVGTQDDEYINGLLHVASDHVAQATALQPEDAVYRLTASCGGSLSSLCVTVPRQPLRSIVSVAADGVQLQATDVDLVDARSRFPVVMSSQRAKEWTLDFVAGHGGLDTASDLIPVADASPLPAQAGHVIKLLTAHWFEIREPLLLGSIRAKLDFTVDALLGMLTRSIV